MEKPLDCMGKRDTVVLQEVERHLAYSTEKMNSDVVARALRYCGELNHSSCQHLSKVYTAYGWNSLLMNIILHMDKGGFEKLCSHIEDKVQIQQLNDVYFAFDSDVLMAPSNLWSSAQRSTVTSKDPPYECSLINVQFLHLTQQLHEMVKNHVSLVDKCQTLMASKKHAIPLFTEEFFKVFSKCDSAKGFQMLRSFWTWSDHSVIRELLSLENNTEAIKLLDKFDSHLESQRDVRLNRFPLPILSSQMVPTHDNMHTVLAIKYLKHPSQCTLDDILGVRRMLMKKCEVTRNSLQLLGVADNDSNYSIIYWQIPKCIVPLMNTKVTENFHSFSKNSVSEIGIYPGILFITKNSTTEMELFSFLGCMENVKVLQIDLQKPDRTLEADETLIKKHEETVKLQHEKAEQMVTLRSQEEEISQLNSKIHMQKSENIKLNKTLTKLKEFRAQDKEELETVKKKAAIDIEALKQQISGLQTYNANLEATIKQTNVTLIESESAADAFKRDAQTLKQELARCSEENRKLTDEEKNAKAKCNEMEQKLKCFKQKCRDYKKATSYAGKALHVATKSQAKNDDDDDNSSTISTACSSNILSLVPEDEVHLRNFCQWEVEDEQEQRQNRSPSDHDQNAT